MTAGQPPGAGRRPQRTPGHARGAKTPLAAIRRLQRELAAAGWDPRSIARVLRLRYPTEISVFASWRYGLGWPSQHAVGQIKANYRHRPDSRSRRPPGLDPTRLNEWEHWPQSGIRAGLLYQEASSRAYGVPVCVLGLSEAYEPYQEDPMRYTNTPAQDVAKLVDAARTVVASHLTDPEVLRAALDGAAHMVGTAGKTPVRALEWAGPAEETAGQLHAWAARVGTPIANSDGEERRDGPGGPASSVPHPPGGAR